MERSSPLAAMQPQYLHFGGWGHGLGGPSSNPQYGRSCGFEPPSFNFKDVSQSTALDYFSSKPIPSSSPTANLAIDLSQNFHIDRSPQLPTPRRSLFSPNFLGAIGGGATMVTPPPPTSSPGPSSDSMDVSPLPHKLPFAATTKIVVHSPTPEPLETPGLDNSPSTSIVGVMNPPVVAERRKSTMLRPSLAKAKAYSTYAVTTKTAGLENQIQPFKFGNGLTSATASLMSLDECFVESPQQSVFPLRTALMNYPPRPKTALTNTSSNFRSNGSPLIGHVRKSSAPSHRPRKQFRRSLSMFESPGEIMKQPIIDRAAEGSLQAIMDIDDAPQLHLPHFFPIEDAIPRISKETMIDILDGKFNHLYDQSLVVDCRFEYEYKGGHIDGAINFNSKEELTTKLFRERSSEKTLLVFHCEYSAHRAPLSAKYLRHEDRAYNAHQYPQLTFPEVYILDGGYSAFFKDHVIRCWPQNYVEMNDKEHAGACERGLGRIKQQRPKAKLGRAQTFAFGQSESPTAANRQSNMSDFVMGMDISVDLNMSSFRAPNRRMASY